ncbi:hypothetical protein, partial [Paludisphaera rhizosphaerae]
MSTASDSREPIERRIYDHCLGTGDPSGHLIDHGSFPPGWVGKFDELLAEAKARWGSESMVPKPLVAALFFASFFPEYRYSYGMARDHRGQGNEQTERDMTHLRSVSGMFLSEVARPIPPDGAR